ncbi:antibiotic biosynthesis monooxygenase [Sinorhizobium medicae]|uniref:Antibiotic biosynthesis monooxygenase n=2 Tax=Sinorhizobium medicae TaxID=110321 RepID=A6U7R7_SINMW|nr:Antibiotic biosynthesis monooxygenase [Sinorhizobium medicae WSM419]MDX0407421.1 antibiotic biosynthesis monooxygenase [Sinorhizobium medicae]MDX0414769.1 antibiotic biosynthesis monooxygenase [Sinorhizobium medicae]MDX0419351.1 antibiotic biosynthesis monooxygenase [Sinorhizobium medicae]MDX0438562.1 antibiotic biosynthesis monooxygenase [Sinorhizobium medicae]
MSCQSFGSEWSWRSLPAKPLPPHRGLSRSRRRSCGFSSFVVVSDDLEAFMVAGRKNVQTSVRDEPGVLSMHCVADKSDPTKLYVVEVYEDEDAYRSHVESAHFRDFINAIKGKVISRRVIETNPKMVGSKQFAWTEQ